MKHTKEEIVNALKVIKEECMANNCYCAECSFYNHGCAIRDDDPCSWQIADTEPETWRAFK